MEPFLGEDDAEEEETAAMDVELGPAKIHAQKTEEERTIDTEGLEEDECEGVSDVAMTPMADILNARNGCDNVHLCLGDSRAIMTSSQARLFHEKNTLNMVAVRPIKHGEQIWNTYGDPPNADLLRRYGHVDIIPINQGGRFPYGNPSDDVEIPADVVFDICLPGIREEQKTRKIEAWLSLDEPEEWVLLPLPRCAAHPCLVVSSLLRGMTSYQNQCSHSSNSWSL